MTQTETRTVAARPRSEMTAIADLKTVKWISSVGVVKRSYDFAEDKMNVLKALFWFVAWTLATINMIVVSIILFIASLPWPDWVKKLFFKLDHTIERILDAVANKLDWWWDNFCIRLMWFRDTLESVIDAALSLCLFIIYKVIEFWMRVAEFCMNILKTLFAPLIKVFHAILPPPQSQKGVPHLQTPMIAINDTPNFHSKLDAKDSELNAVRTDGTTSDSESDVSAVAESWTRRLADKSGTSYSRVDMKATAEGRLRDAMYKRVKGQLGIMRKNSVHFSRGMTSYIRVYLQPKVTPALTSMKLWLRDIANKYNLLEAFDKVVAWIDRHYLISTFVYFHLSLAMIPLRIFSALFLGEKKRSRRTRSMRSESLRRRTGACSSSVVSPSNQDSLGLIKSAEPVLEDPQFEVLRRYNKISSSKGSEDDSVRDSALASSIDDLCHTSDSNDGSSFLKDQTIHEHQDEDDEEDIDGACDIPKNDVLQRDATSNGGIPQLNRKIRMDTEVSGRGNRRTGRNAVLPDKQFVTLNSNTNHVDSKSKSVKKEVATTPNRQKHEKQKASPQSSLKELNTEVTKNEDPPSTLKGHHSDHDEKQDKPEKTNKRKISFSLDVC